jgi:hypothetical protein
MKYLFFLPVVLLCIVGQGHAQNGDALRLMEKKADSLYLAKSYVQAGNQYLALSRLYDFVSQKKGMFYNVACCQSLAGNYDSAFSYLQQAIVAGYNRKAHIMEDTDLMPLHADARWQKLLRTVKEEPSSLNSDPSKVHFITDDVHHFWAAYDKAQKDTAHYKAIFVKYYFDPASRGMQDYMGAKVSSIDAFIAHIRSAPRFYQSIRKNTLQADVFKPRFMESFKAMKALYPQAAFPSVYFVIGAFTSGGTVTNMGLLLGLNQASQDEHTPVDELSARLQTRMNNVEYLPNIVAHELIHFQQAGLKRDTTTLYYSIMEGMCDFIGELISGNNSNPKLIAWAKGKEKQIWQRFTADMYYNRYDNWIANSRQATADNLPDQGYWIGYQICKAYYEEAADKKQAIYDILHIQDYKAFLARSKWEEKLQKL